jgi:triosephosphate isomerase
MRRLNEGNWKMNGLAPQLCEIEAVAAEVAASRPLAGILLCLTATLIARGTHAAGGRIAIGGDNCHADTAGTLTGDVGAETLSDAGASTVIVGHSERSRHHGESAALYERLGSRWEADFADKLLSALRYQFGGHEEKAADATRGA